MKEKAGETEILENNELLESRAIMIMKSHFIDIKIRSITKRSDGFYNVIYGDNYPCTAVLDLDFPFSEKEVSDVIKESEGREICLFIGTGKYDLPIERLENGRADERRVFLVSEIGFGVTSEPENISSSCSTGFISNGSYAVTSSNINDLPGDSYLFGLLNFGQIPEGSIDLIYTSNLFNDPGASIRSVDLINLLKVNTGELLIVSTNTPDKYSLKDLKRDFVESGCDVEVLWYRENSEVDYLMPDDVAGIVREKTSTVVNRAGDIGSYVVVVRKRVL